MFPVYAVLIGIATSGFGILPGFFAGYVCAFVVKFLEKKLPAGVEFLAILFIAAPISRGMAMLMDPLVNATLGKIGSMISVATTESPIIMGIMLGGLITVISTSPLSSMALTAMLGLTGLPMAIGSLAVAASAPMNFIFFKRLKICSKKDTIAVAIEPLTQADVVSANPIQFMRQTSLAVHLLVLLHLCSSSLIMHQEQHHQSQDFLFYSDLMTL